jgi:uracil-DNA glycosylase
MKLEEILPQSLADASVEEVINVWHRLSQWYANAISTGAATENIINAAIWTMEEAERRGVTIDKSRPLAMAALALKKGDGEEWLRGLPDDIVIIKDFVALVGSAATKDDPGDIDILLRGEKTQDNKHFKIQADNILLPVRKALHRRNKKDVHFIDNPQGPHANYRPIYSLILRREEPKIHLIKSDEYLPLPEFDPWEPFNPEKPLMKGFTEFFDAIQIWPWARSKLEQGYGLIGEEKFDGFRLICKKKGNEVQCTSADFDRTLDIKPLKDALLKIKGDFVIDGELMAMRDGKVVPRTQVFTMIQGEQGLMPYYKVFDILWWQKENLTSKILKERKDYLNKFKTVIGNCPIISVAEHREITDEESLKNVGTWASENPYSEGLMVKIWDSSVWEDATFAARYKREATDDWAKLKTIFEVKVAVKEINPTKDGKHTYTAALQDEDGWYTIGKTFATDKDLAKVGETLNVVVEELILLREKDGTEKLTWGKPTPKGPDRSRRPYTKTQVIDMGERAHVLKREVSPATIRKNLQAKVLFIGLAPSRLEQARRKTLVGDLREPFIKAVIDPLGLKENEWEMTYIVNVYDPSPTDDVIKSWMPETLQYIDRVQPTMVISLGQKVHKALGGASHFVIPHPELLKRGMGLDETARKIRAIKKAAEMTPEEAARDDTRVGVASEYYNEHWMEMRPTKDDQKFVYQFHVRGLTEDETKLSLKELIDRGHSVHGDLRFESNGTLWGFTVFEGNTEELKKNNYVPRLLNLKEGDALQGTFKLRQPNPWLHITDVEPLITGPAGAGSTAHKFAKFFKVWDGSYTMPMARLHGREIYLNGIRYMIQYAPMGENQERVWLITKPKSNESYTATHDKNKVLEELAEKGQTALLWSTSTTSTPKLLYIHDNENTPIRKTRIIKADKDKQIITGIVLEPDTVDAQGDTVSKEEIEKAAWRYMVSSRVIGLKHRDVAEAEVVESFIAPVDLLLGGQEVAKGSWIMSVHVTDKDLWDSVKDGELQGFSVGGFGNREEA